MNMEMFEITLHVRMATPITALIRFKGLCTYIQVYTSTSLGTYVHMYRYQCPLTEPKGRAEEEDRRERSFWLFVFTISIF